MSFVISQGKISQILNIFRHNINYMLLASQLLEAPLYEARLCNERLYMLIFFCLF